MAFRHSVSGSLWAARYIYNLNFIFPVLFFKNMRAQPGFEPGIPCIRGKPPKASILPLDHWAALFVFFSPYIGIRRQRMGNTSSTELSMEQERLLDCDVPHVRRLHINTNQPERPWIYHLYRLSNLFICNVSRPYSQPSCSRIRPCRPPTSGPGSRSI